MSTPALIAMAVLNLVAAVGFLRDSNPPMALVFTCYAVACCGFIWGNR